MICLYFFTIISLKLQKETRKLLLANDKQEFTCNMKEKFYRFMQGRYGADEFSKFLTGVSMAMLILNILTRRGIFNLMFWACLFYSYFRMFSKNYGARYGENQKFLGLKAKWLYQWENYKKMRQQKKIYHIYSCPYCKQKIRIPKGKGTIIITCPKCRQEFGKRS